MYPTDKPSVLHLARLSVAFFATLLLSSLANGGAVEDAMNKHGRLPADIERDARSRPEVTLGLLQLEPADRVADIWAGSGYYSELMGSIVGPEGEVLLINNEAYAGFVKKGLDERMSGRELNGVTIHNAEAEDLKLGDGTLDAAVIIMSYHDTYHVDEKGGWRAIDAADFLGQIYKGLKPGGRFLVVDHYAAAATGKASAQDLHRIDVEFAKQDIGSYGFVLADSSDALRNSEDDYSVMVFQPEVRGKTDRFVLVFEKPAD